MAKAAIVAMPAIARNTPRMWLNVTPIASVSSRTVYCGVWISSVLLICVVVSLSYV